MKKIEWIREALSVWPSPIPQQREKSLVRKCRRRMGARVQAERPHLQDLAAGAGNPLCTRIARLASIWKRTHGMQVLKPFAEMVVQDHSYNHMAQSLNEHSFRTRDGKAWTALAVFKLTPRLIEVAPRILSGAEWENRKRQLSLRGLELLAASFKPMARLGEARPTIPRGFAQASHALSARRYSG